MSAYWASEQDRLSYREIVAAKVRELRKESDDQSRSSFSPTSPDYAFVAILVSGLIGCCGTSAIAEGLEFDADFVNEVTARLRASHLWSETEYIGSHELTDGEADSGLCFFLHVGVAKGQMARGENGNYHITPAGVRHVEALLKRAADDKSSPSSQS